MRLTRVPGVLLAFTLAALALQGATWPLMRQLGFSALTLAILGGMLVGNTVFPRFERPCRDGIVFAKQRLLRAGIILFGFRLTFHDVAAVGWTGLLIDTLIIVSTFSLAYVAGRRALALDEQSVILIGTGSSICGAAAVLAVEPVVKADAEKVTVAIATVVVFGTVAMFVWPALFGLVRGWGVSEFSYGLYAGSTVHEVAQAAVAGRAVSELAMNTSVITKMLRVMMLAPFIVILSAWLSRRGSAPAGGRAPIVIPWFAVGFLGVAAFNSFGLLPAAWVQTLVQFDTLLLAAAMAALGVTTRLSAIRQAGARPLVLALGLFVWLMLGGAAINAVVTWLMA
jgi:uncharacterized integral membrane protein (TIGR00698 family)